MRRIRTMLIGAGLFFLAFVMAVFCHVQGSTASMLAKCKTRPERSLPDANVTAIEKETNHSAEATSGKDGGFVLRSLPVKLHSKPSLQEIGVIANDLSSLNFPRHFINSALNQTFLRAFQYENPTPQP